MPPRRTQVRHRLTGDRGMRAAVAVAFYADRIMVGDIVEVCSMSVSAVLREVIRAGVPLRHRQRDVKSRALAAIIADAKLTPLDVDEWRHEIELSETSARAVWHLAGREQQTSEIVVARPAPVSQLKRRCQQCGAIGANPERCEICLAPR